MREAKKQLEVLLVNYFRECYDDFPKGRVVPSESPDFLIKSKQGKKYGIELTRMHPAIPFGALPNRNDDNLLGRDLIEQVRDLFERTCELKLFVKFLFSEKKILKPERVLSVSVALAGLIRKQVVKRSPRSYFHVVVSGNELPDGVKELLLVHHPEMSESVWELSNNLGISENVVGDLYITIRKKEEKLKLYQKQHLDACWLLITIDRLKNKSNSNVANQLLRADFQSYFNRVLLFELIKSKVFELKMPSF